MLNVWLAEPRGFCAGVCRALRIVDDTIQKYGTPVYVRNEIVHNKYVVSALKAKGVIFVEETSEADPARPIIISAHGAADVVFKTAAAQGINLIDATCPLVAKVHNQVKNFAAKNMEIIVIGKPGHPEIIGTIGQVDNAKIHIISKVEDIENLIISTQSQIGFVTQTTLSSDDTKDIVTKLKSKFPKLVAQKSDDICYATLNRQKAVKAISEKSDLVVIIGSKNSSNSKQLQNVAAKYGKKSYLIDDCSELDPSWLQNVQNIGVSAGASAPEYLVEDLLSFLKKHYNNINIQNVIIAEEKTEFKK